MEEAPAVVGLLDLPPDLLANILLHHGDDDYHMLTLPLTCTALWRVCAARELSAARLASRLRQVAAAVVTPKLGLDNEWALAHAWGALSDAERFLCPDGVLDRARVLVCLLYTSPSPRDS